MSGGDSDVSLNVSLDVEHPVSWWKVDKGLLDFVFFLQNSAQGRVNVKNISLLAALESKLEFNS